MLLVTNAYDEHDTNLLSGKIYMFQDTDELIAHIQKLNMDFPTSVVWIDNRQYVAIKMQRHPADGEEALMINGEFLVEYDPADVLSWIPLARLISVERTITIIKRGVPPFVGERT